MLVCSYRKLLEIRGTAGDRRKYSSAVGLEFWETKKKEERGHTLDGQEGTGVQVQKSIIQMRRNTGQEKSLSH